MSSLPALERARYVTTAAALEAPLAAWQVAPVLGLDIETTSLDPRQGAILLVQLSDGQETLVVRWSEATRRPLCEFLGAYAGTFAIQHAKFEYQWLLVHGGIRLGRVFDTKLADLVLRCGRDHADETSHLEDLVARYLGLRLDKTLQTSFVGVDPANWQPSREQIQYAALDAWAARRLQTVLERRLQQEGLSQTMQVENRLVPVLAEMELHGMAIDTAQWRDVLDELRAQQQLYTERLAAVLTPPLAQAQARQYAAAQAAREQWEREREAYWQALEAQVPALPTQRERRAWRLQELKRRYPLTSRPGLPRLVEGPINLQSSRQLLLALHELGIRVADTQSLTLEEYLRKHDGQPAFLRELLEWRAFNKLETAFGERLLERVRNGRIYPTIHQLVRTGRMSMRDPNLMQIPAGQRGGPAAELARRLRRAFVAPPGRRLIVADYAAIEHRIAVELSGDPVALREYAKGDQADVHRATASAVFRVAPEAVTPQQRHAAKMINYGIIYGISPGGLALRLGCSTDEARELLARWREAHRVLARWLDREAARALAFGESRTPLGRRRLYSMPERPRVPPSEAPQAWRDYRAYLAAIERQAKNQPIQGCSADITKIALLRIHTRLRKARLDAAIVNAVHDEIVVEACAPDAEAAALIVREEMARAAQMFLKRVPVVVDCRVSQVWEH